MGQWILLNFITWLLKTTAIRDFLSTFAARVLVIAYNTEVLIIV
jgi:hypothetical protein